MCGRPGGPLAHPMAAPVLRFQTGETFGPLELEMRCRIPPDWSITLFPDSPERDEEKASLLPSGDHDGEVFVPPNRGKDTMRFRSKEHMRISHPEPLHELNASGQPSG